MEFDKNFENKCKWKSHITQDKHGVIEKKTHHRTTYHQTEC